MDLTLVIGNRNYSSWSLRPWLALKLAGLSFTEQVIPLGMPDTADRIRRVSPSGKVPCLVHGDTVVWESLAICEYVADLAPKAGLWPTDPAARATARAISAEMHAGFAALRNHYPMNIRALKPTPPTPDCQADINRITALWRDARRRFAGHKPFLFGDAGIADCMFAPVVTRFTTYEPALDQDAKDYMAAVLSLPAMKDWVSAAKAEPWIHPKFDV